MIDLSKLFILLPLFVALAVIVRKARKAYGAASFGADEKEIVREAWKGIAYIFAASILTWWLLPPLGGGGTFCGLLVSSLLSILIVLCVVDLPDRLNQVHNLMWREWHKTPIYSKTDEPVEYVRWARRFAMVLFVLFVFVAALLGGNGHAQPSASAKGGNTPSGAAPTSSVPSTAAPKTTQPAPVTSGPQATATPTTSDGASVAPEYVDNPCDGPKQIEKVDEPSTAVFKMGVLICYNGKWQHWSDITATARPTHVTVEYWTVAGPYGYGRVIDPNTGDPYFIRTNKG